jgi:curved DNA-binding protein CbpA
VAGRDPYAVLGVAPDADGPAIHAAYRRAVRRTHPDAGGSAAEFEAVQDAYETLRDPARRAAHDRGRPAPRRSATPPPPRRPASPATDAEEPSADLRAEADRLEDEARILAGLPPRGRAEKAGETGDSFSAILDDAGKQLGDVAQAAARELRRRLRRLL